MSGGMSESDGQRAVHEADTILKNNRLVKLTLDEWNRLDDFVGGKLMQPIIKVGQSESLREPRNAEGDSLVYLMFRLQKSRWSGDQESRLWIRLGEDDISLLPAADFESVIAKWEGHDPEQKSTGAVG